MCPFKYFHVEWFVEILSSLLRNYVCIETLTESKYIKVNLHNDRVSCGNDMRSGNIGYAVTGKWEVRSEKWEVRSGKWEVRSGK